MFNKIKILLLGATSQVGYRFYTLNSLFEIVGVCRNVPHENNCNFIQSDMSSKSIEHLIKTLSPDIIINCLSVGDIDTCELSPIYTHSINVNLAIDILNLSEKYNIKLVTFSSSQIYDGLEMNYSEISIARPINEYGKQKLQFDTIIREYINKHVLLRLTTIIGTHENFQRYNPVGFLISKISNNENLLLVNDVITNFLYVDDLAKILNTILINNISGEYNVAGDESISRYELGLKVKSLFNSSYSMIQPCNSYEFKTIAPRPHNAVLNNNKIKKIIRFEFTHIDSALKYIIQK